MYICAGIKVEVQQASHCGNNVFIASAMRKLA